MTRTHMRGSWGIPWLGLPLSGVLALTGAAHSFWTLDPVVGPGETVAAGLPSDLGAGEPDAPVRIPDRQSEIRRGETLGSILLGLGVEPDDVHQVALAAARHIELRQLRAGTPWRAYLDTEGRLDRFQIVLAERGELTIDRAEEGWRPDWHAFARQARVRTVRGTLEGSLEASMGRAGAAPELAYEMAEVLQWDLDFSRDLRRGDEFRVLFEEVLVEGYEPRPDRVLAVSYGRPEGSQIEAYFFGEGDGAGYYDAEGRPLQKMFLRSPMLYSRVTSGFSSRRFHPVLGSYRPHYGVDYGAPVGTPVRVTASGTVISAGWDGGGGKTIKVRHANGYKTAYLHLSRFASGIRSGAVVRQGDVIGFVGATGLATGPHLDYRVQLNGRWINPLSLKSVPAEPISNRLRTAFVSRREAMRASLETGEAFAPPGTVLASHAAVATRGAASGTSASGRKR